MFRPDRFAPRLCDVSLDDLAARGIRGLIIDLDNTLVAYRCSDILNDHLNWVELAQRRGFKIVMLSNNFSDRVQSIALLVGGYRVVISFDGADLEDDVTKQPMKRMT